MSKPPPPTSEDPFACFDSDNDSSIGVDDAHDDNDDNVLANDEDQGIPPRPIAKRDPQCGVLAFHAGTELSLLTHVQNEMRQRHQNVENESAALAVLRSIDNFCFERHWMMHVGPEKGQQLTAFLQQYAAVHTQTKESPMVIVELGTYCGYASVLLANSLKQNGLVNFHIYTVEVNPQNAKVATEIIRLAKLESYISVLLRDLTIPNHLETSLMTKEIDFLFIDHDKDAYCSDLQRLEQAGRIRKGTHVAADNVIFARIDNYRNYVQDLAHRGIVETQLVVNDLEYSAPDQHGSSHATDIFRDGIELTIYRQDPLPRST